MITDRQVTDMIHPYGMTLIRKERFVGDRENILVDVASTSGFFARFYRDRKVNECEISYGLECRDWLSLTYIFEVEGVEDDLSAFKEAEFKLYVQHILPIIHRHISVLKKYASKNYFKKKDLEITEMNKRKFEEKYPGCIG